MKITLPIFAFLSLTLALYGQPRELLVRGRVSDHYTGIQGVNIFTKQTHVKTTTTDQGYFEILATMGDTLVLSHLEYQTLEVRIQDAEKPLLLVMERNETQLQTVEIQTGYTSIKANLINGSVTHLTHEDLQKSNDPNILKRLEGITNGLAIQVGRNNSNPQRSTNITIRGYSTINGPLDPLIVVDNFVYEGDIENINPEDVDHVTILKDAEATSIYGARGGNGVIVITLKKGRAIDKILVSANLTRNILPVPNVNLPDQMDNENYIEVERFLFENGFFNSDLSHVSRPVTPVVDILDRIRNGEITREEGEILINQLKKNDFRQEYTDAFYETGHSTQSGIRFTGGNHLNIWTIGSNYNEIVSPAGQYSNRFNVSVSNTLNLRRWLSIAFGVNYARRNGRSGDVPSYASLTSIGNRQWVPYLSFQEPDGTQIPFYSTFKQSYLDTVGGGLLLDWSYYPLQDRDKTSRKASTNELIGNLGLNIDLTTSLKLSLSYQYQNQATDNRTEHDQSSYFVREMVNRYAQIDYINQTAEFVIPDGSIMDKSTSRQNSSSFRGQLNYDFRHDKHMLLSFAGFESRARNEGGDVWRYFGYQYDPLGYMSVNYNQVYPVRPQGFAYVPGGSFPQITYRHRFISVYGNFNYTYAGRYSLSGNIRKDASNIYGLKTNDKWTPLWSLGMGYTLSNEPFFRTDLVEYLKLKATIGYSGNVDLSRSALPVANYMPGSTSPLPMARITTINNPRLKWEQVMQWSLGAEWSFKHGFSGSIEVYGKKGYDLYGPTDYDYTAWGPVATITTNVADMAGQGVEVYLNKRGIGDGLVGWTPTLIYNYNINKTVNYYSTNNDHPLYRVVNQDGLQITPINGIPFYALAAYRWGGLDEEGNPMVYLDGVPTTDYEQVVSIASDQDHTGNHPIRLIGSAIPLHYGSFNQDFRIWKLNVSVGLMYKFGYHFRMNSIIYDNLVQFGAGHADFKHRWQQPGDEKNTDIPAFVYPLPSNRRNIYLRSDHLVERGDHIRLKHVNVRYRFDRLSIGRRFSPGGSISLTTTDLGVVWKATRQQVDPDYPTSVHPGRNLSLGLTLDF